MSTDTLPLLQIKPKSEFSGILKDQETYAAPNASAGVASNDVNSWFDRLMVQSGANISPAIVLLLSLCCALLAGGIIFVMQENLLLTAILAGVGAMVPVIVLMFMRSRRQSKILNQMPPMVDELARAAKAGRSLPACLSMVAEDTPSPLGDEMRICSGKLAMGIPLSAALEELPERTGVNTLRILTTALNVHQLTGGDLVSVLERLSRTLRDRSQFLGRLRAATSASRATAILMLVLPLLILGFFLYRDPGYFQKLMTSSWGWGATMIGIALQVIGAAWVFRILSNTQKS